MARSLDGHKPRWLEVRMARSLNGQRSKWSEVQMARSPEVQMFRGSPEVQMI